MFKRFGAKADLAAIGAILVAATAFAAAALAACALFLTLDARMDTAAAAVWSALVFITPLALAAVVQLANASPKTEGEDPPAILERVADSPLALVAPPALIALAGRKPLLALVIAGIAAVAARDFSDTRRL
jgi:hypothetical protein